MSTEALTTVTAGDLKAGLESEHQGDYTPKIRRITAFMHGPSVYLIALLFGAAGSAHFAWPAVFARIVPPYLPVPYALVYVSGAAELLGAVAALVPGLQPYAGWGLILLLLAVFPANVHMALHPSAFERFPAWALYLRLPLQFVMIGWIYWALGLRVGWE